MVSKTAIRVMSAALVGVFVMTVVSSQPVLGWPPPIQDDTGFRNNPNPGVYPPQSSPFGKTYGEWSAEYVQAVFGNPWNPFEPEGCSFGSQGTVVFLAATTGGAQSFSCTLPSGSSLLTPVVTDFEWVPWSCQYVENCTDADALRAFAKAIVDATVLLEAEVDGVPVENLAAYRFTSPVFSGTAVEGNIFWQLGLPVVGPYGPAVADGYWVMLTPLPPGDHVVHIHAVIGDPFPFDGEVTHYITIAPGGGEASQPPASTTSVVPSTWGSVKSLYR